MIHQLSNYPLVNSHIAMESHHAINEGKQTVSIPEGSFIIYQIFCEFIFIYLHFYLDLRFKNMVNFPWCLAKADFSHPRIFADPFLGSVPMTVTESSTAEERSTKGTRIYW